MAEGVQQVADSVLANRHVATRAEIAYTKVIQSTSVVMSIPLTHWREWDSLVTNTPGTPATTYLGVTTGTYGSEPPPYLSTGDVKAAGCTRRARALVQVPKNYDPGEALTLRAYCGMRTTISDGTTTILFEAYRLSRETGALGDSLVTTSATSFKSLTVAAKDFTMTTATVLPGDWLDVRMTVAIVDAATGTAVIGAIYATELLCTLRG